MPRGGKGATIAFAIGARYGALEVVGRVEGPGNFWKVACGCGSTTQKRASYITRHGLCSRECPLNLRAMSFDPSGDPYSHGVGLCHIKGCEWRVRVAPSQWADTAAAHILEAHPEYGGREGLIKSLHGHYPSVAA